MSSYGGSGTLGRLWAFKQEFREVNWAVKNVGWAVTEIAGI